MSVPAAAGDRTRGWHELNAHLPVLETGALPVELHPLDLRIQLSADEKRRLPGSGGGVSVSLDFSAYVRRLCAGLLCSSRRAKGIVPQARAAEPGSMCCGLLVACHRYIVGLLIHVQPCLTLTVGVGPVRRKDITAAVSRPPGRRTPRLNEKPLHGVCHQQVFEES